MGARHKLNQAYVNGAVIVGIAAWLITGSTIIFWAALLSCLALNLYGGGIRIRNPSRGGRTIDA